MFGKKKCQNCEKSIDKKFDFCPYCGETIVNKEKREADYGLLGKDDYLEEGLFKSPMLGFGDSMVKGMIRDVARMLDREMRGIHEMQKMPINKDMPKNIKHGFELYINGRRVNLQNNLAGIQIGKIPANEFIKRSNAKTHKQDIPKISEDTLQKSAKLPRKEAKAHLTRTSDKVIYEIEAPGISSLENVLVNRLESSVEIRVYTKETVYIKTLSVKLPLIKYSINPEQGKLILEFKAG